MYTCTNTSPFSTLKSTLYVEDDHTHLIVFLPEKVTCAEILRTNILRIYGKLWLHNKLSRGKGDQKFFPKTLYEKKILLEPVWIMCDLIMQAWRLLAFLHLCIWDNSWGPMMRSGLDSGYFLFWLVTRWVKNCVNSLLLVCALHLAVLAFYW